MSIFVLFLSAEVFSDGVIFFEIQKEPPEVFCKYVFLKLGQNSLENTCDGVSFLIKSHANLIKKTPT